MVVRFVCIFWGLQNTMHYLIFWFIKIIFVICMSLKIVMGQRIHVHGKLMFKSNFMHFTESRFTLVINCEIMFTLNPHDFSDYTWNQLVINKYLSQITINKENCYSRILCFTQMVKCEITIHINFNPHPSQIGSRKKSNNNSPNGIPSKYVKYECRLVS